MEVKELVKLVQENGHALSKKSLKDAVKFAKKCGDAELAYELACIIEGNERLEMEKIVLKAQEPKFCYLFARDIPNANVKAHQSVILNKKSAEFSVEFASDISNVDVRALSNVVLESKNPEYAYKFALEVDILPKLEASLKEDLSLFNRISKKLNLDKYKSAKLADEAYKKELYQVAKDKANKMLNNLQQVVIESKDAKYSELFKRDIEGADIRKLRLAKGRILKTSRVVAKNIDDFTK